MVEVIQCSGVGRNDVIHYLKMLINALFYDTFQPNCHIKKHINALTKLHSHFQGSNQGSENNDNTFEQKQRRQKKMAMRITVVRLLLQSVKIPLFSGITIFTGNLSKF